MKVLQDKYQKIKTYAGFAIRAGKAAIGTDNLLSAKRLYVALIDETLSENAAKKIASHCEKLACPLYTAENAAELISKEGCKAFGIKDKSLASAIINCVQTDA